MKGNRKCSGFRMHLLNTLLSSVVACNICGVCRTNVQNLTRKAKNVKIIDDSKHWDIQVIKNNNKESLKEYYDRTDKLQTQQQNTHVKITNENQIQLRVCVDNTEEHNLPVDPDMTANSLKEHLCKDICRLPSSPEYYSLTVSTPTSNVVILHKNMDETLKQLGFMSPTTVNIHKSGNTNREKSNYQQPEKTVKEELRLIVYSEDATIVQITTDSNVTGSQLLNNILTKLKRPIKEAKTTRLIIHKPKFDDEPLSQERLQCTLKELGINDNSKITITHKNIQTIKTSEKDTFKPRSTTHSKPHEDRKPDTSKSFRSDIKLAIYFKDNFLMHLHKNPETTTAEELLADLRAHDTVLRLPVDRIQLCIHRINKKITESMYKMTLKQLDIADQTEIRILAIDEPSTTSNQPHPLSPRNSLAAPSSKTMTQLNKRAGVCGLINQGNTCFMNSALQCLRNVPPLTLYFLNHGDLNLNCGETISAYADFISKVWLHPKGDYFEPSLLKHCVSQFAPQFIGYAQHDAQEFMNFLLDALHEDLKRFGDGRHSIIADLFHGETQTIVQCSRCDEIEITKNLFTFLPLPLQKKGRLFAVTYCPRQEKSRIYWVETARNGNISSLINDFLSTYKRSPRTEKFCTHTPIESHIEVVHSGTTRYEHNVPLVHVPEEHIIFEQTCYKVPTYKTEKAMSSNDSDTMTLTECLEEFTTQETLGENGKWHCPICNKLRVATKKLDILSFPEVLIIQLKRFVYDDSDNKINKFVSCPLTNLDLSALSTDSNANYNLVAVANHKGSLEYGHYVTNAKNFNNGKWYQFDDRHVNEINLEEDIITDEAYILVYAQKK
ncbi:unnamed protein product [Didymodactylos carnosus]|uniref:Ubiquitin carboxyl-terminal hydrolase n=1 Tax=Didymodactylos carnosus TaxID=1234261 RepID=A0A814SRA7_9BILA|nr:unnamed protein product [Didymodactylos carnosus]CAF3914772.1 unnamed protein product [Didymodactylos carnosus]